jgi:hypothetical protein
LATLSFSGIRVSVMTPFALPDQSKLVCRAASTWEVKLGTSARPKSCRIHNKFVAVG